MKNELAKVDGNCMLIPEHERDHYYCSCCGDDVREEFYNHKQEMCFQCWFNNKGDI